MGTRNGDGADGGGVKGRARSVRRGLGWLTLIGVLTTAALVAQAAGAGATTIRAPFTSATVTLTNPMTHAGSGRGVLVTAAFFNRTTGLGGFSDNASATWKTTSTNNSILATGRIQVNLPITVPSTGAKSVTIVWTTLAVGSVNLTAGTCRGNSTVATTSCTRFVQAFIHGFAILQDKTNNTNIRVQNWPGNFTAVWSNTTCSFTHCTTSASTGHTSALHTGKAFWSWDFTGLSLVSTHKYVIEMMLFGGAQVTLSVSGATLKGASGNAQFNTGTRGNEEILDSVTIS